MTWLVDLCEPWPPGVPPMIDRLDVVDVGFSRLQRLYRDQGFVILPRFLDDGLIGRYQGAWRADNAARPMGWPCDVPYMHVGAVRDLCCYSNLALVLEQMLGEPAGVHLNLTGWRSTGRGWHQDGYLNPDSNGDHYAAVWMALDDVSPDAGPFEYVPGSHRQFGVVRRRLMMAALEPHERGTDWPEHSERILTPLFERAIAWDALEVRQFVARRGDVLIWHPRLLHRGSTPTNPDLERRACIAHFSGIHHRPDMPPAERHNAGWFFPLRQGHGRCQPGVSA